MVKDNNKQLEEFQGFKVLPVHIDSSLHYIYLRRHETKSTLMDEDMKDRTLFALNLPVDVTPQKIEQLFKGLTIKEIKFRDTYDHEQVVRPLWHSGCAAHIVFKKEEAVDKALNMKRSIKQWPRDTEQDQPLGFDRYELIQKLSRPDPFQLKQELDLFMKKFKEDEFKKEKEKVERMNKMDEDGFTVVVRHKNMKSSDGSISVGAAAENSQPKKKKELVNFYRFQMRQKKEEELVELRKRFEEDKVKIARLKQTRKFKPY
ncbi:ribosomal RNA-processing protein 7-domain-containing protein [Pilobolus umbonatus]|nr:ribosomal RNA-processing protein 7-domain-containing protein [Pilobolus umbonatus]